MQNIRIPAWLIAICAFVFMGILLEQLYWSKRPVDLWGLKLNQATCLAANVMQTGNTTVGHKDSGWTLSGERSPSDDKINTRTHDLFIRFPTKFVREPYVHAAISHIDATAGGNAPTVNIRAKLEVVERNDSGFKVRISTWDGSKVWGIGISWLAYVPEAIK